MTSKTTKESNLIHDENLSQLQFSEPVMSAIIHDENNLGNQLNLIQATRASGHVSKTAMNIVELYNGFVFLFFFLLLFFPSCFVHLFDFSFLKFGTAIMIHIFEMTSELFVFCIQ